MKKLLINLVVYSAIVLSATKATAHGTSAAREGKPAICFAVSTLRNSSMDASVHPVAASDRTTQNFLKQFAGTTDAVWTKQDNGFVVRFTSNGIQNCAYLTKRGYCHSLIRYYTEKELPADIRHQVKSTYYDFAITSVTEVRHNDTQAYMVTISDETTWKVIRVIDGEMELWKTYRKG